MSALLQIEGLRAAYGSSAVLHGIDLQLQQGEVMGLLGRNGMGKTTLIRSLLGLHRQRSGRLRFAGQDITALRADQIARLGLAIVPEGRQVFSNLSVIEHLTAFARNLHRAPDPWTPERVLALFARLGERRDHMGSQLSGGEQQMLAIGRALVTNPLLLILDEATEGLAPLIREDIWRCLAQLRAAGQTLIVVDKYVNRLVDLGDHHHILERGQTAWRGSSDALRADRGIWTRYLGV